MVAVIELILTCDECGRSTDPFVGGLIDQYSWHDAPTYAVMIDDPAGWYSDPDANMLGLCPEHNTAEVRAQEKYRGY